MHTALVQLTLKPASTWLLHITRGRQLGGDQYYWLCDEGVQLEEPFSVLPLEKLARECQDDIMEMIALIQGANVNNAL